MSVWDVAKLVLIIATPTLLGAALLYAPKWWEAASAYRQARRPPDSEPSGPPIERLAADLRRLLRLHASLTASAHIAMRAHRLWSVEAAIAVRAVETARALDVPHPPTTDPGDLHRDQIAALLHRLSAAGLVLPAHFTSDGRL
ncbi:hypothetical protein GCM10010172_61430 [Paractinoplanes ferrugineus]|uniref:Uncharacterized protein n=1 Tax=Paractinoplanes ferrugineus TaxID=113564 RepID=A0A919J8C9_9ACTN|nr:hypothetical protein [Actinoplanes ferrugineus]GIE14529.1 hypothetical protein Afe05nite_63690 [Actinoplanes ferrugineus]